MATRLSKRSFTPIKKAVLFILFLMISLGSSAQFSVDAGKDTTFCTGQNIESLLLGTTAKIENGVAPYTISWECKIPKGMYSNFFASDLLSDTTILSPHFLYNPNHVEWIKFTLTVTDSENNVARDSLFVRFSRFVILTGGGQPRFYIEKGDSILLSFPNAGIGGGIEPLTYYWRPKTFLSDPDSLVTWCKPDSSIQYEAYAIDSCGCVSAIETVYDIRVLPEKKSHDYQTVYSSRIALFENSEKQIKALRIDSVKTDIDSVFYPFATIQEVSENCFSPYKASWMGEKVVVKPDGTNLFFNRDGDTITLKTRARLNESWIAFQHGDDFRVKATVQSVGLKTFLGLTDSVKTISLTVIDKNENTLEHPLNIMELKISKNYGFVETLNFNLFPNIEVHHTQEQLETYSLVGLTNPNVGIQNLTWFEVNDFQPGDELHVLYETSDWPGSPTFPGYSRRNKSIFKYLERSDYQDSVVFRFVHHQSTEGVLPDTTALRIYIDTLKSVIIANPSFDKLPGEPIFKELDPIVSIHYMTNGSLISKTDPDSYEKFYSSDNICWGMMMFDGCARNNTYFKGLGGPYYKCTNCCSLGGEERKLVYYKKGETEWGEKLVIIPDTNDNKPEFAPIGAEWYYNYDPDITLDDGYQKISVLKDTIIDNHNCRLLQIRNIGYSYFYQKNYNYKAGNIILYESGDTVHYYKNGQFYILYDFSAKSGDTFYSISNLPNCTQAFKVRVDSITNIEINDQLLKKFHVTLNDSLQANYIEKIGYNDYLLPQFGLGCEILTGPHYPGPLRCYYDNKIGVYSTNIVSACDYITSSDEIEMLNEGIRVFPNPAASFVTISNPSNIPIKTIKLTDFSGRVVQTWRVQELVENTLNIQHIPPGIYLLKATTEAGIKTGKLVVQ